MGLGTSRANKPAESSLLPSYPSLARRIDLNRKCLAHACKAFNDHRLTSETPFVNAEESKSEVLKHTSQNQSWHAYVVKNAALKLELHELRLHAETFRSSTRTKPSWSQADFTSHSCKSNVHASMAAPLSSIGCTKPFNLCGCQNGLPHTNMIPKIWLMQ